MTDDTAVMDALALPNSLEQRTTVELARMVAKLTHAIEQLLKPYDLTPTQYNVLRILNGAGGDGLCGSDIGRRLISQVPDMTRLLDRMAAAGLITRERSTEHRSFVTTRLADLGRRKLVEITPHLDALHRERFRRFTPGQLAQLRELVALVETESAAS